MSEYVYCWQVKDLCGLDELTRTELVVSLAGIKGAIQENREWQLIPETELPEMPSYANWLWARAAWLHSAMQKLAGHDIHQVRGILGSVIMMVYRGKRPEMVGLPDTFSGKDDFLDFEQHFRPLYFDSLHLKREAVREYCKKNEIRQIKEMKGYLLEGAPSPSPRSHAEQAVATFKSEVVGAWLSKLQSALADAARANDAEFELGWRDGKALEADGAGQPPANPVNNATSPVADAGRSLSAYEVNRAVADWKNYRNTLTSSTNQEKRKRHAAHIAELKFMDKTHREIFNIVFPSEQDVKSGTKRKRISDYKTRIEEIAREAHLPMPPWKT